MRIKLLSSVLLLLCLTQAWADDSGKCGDDLTWSYISNTYSLVISGSGEMYNYDSSVDTPWYDKDVTNIIIENGVTTIGDKAFYYNNTLSLIVIPSSVVSIGEFAFYRCTELSSISIPTSVKTIGYGAFSNCEALSTLTIPNGVKTIGEFAFSDCKALSTLTIPESVETIGVWAFSGCTNLASVSIPYGITTINNGTFCWCSNLSSVNLPNSLLTIGDQAFEGCSFESITIPESVTSIGGFAFYECTNLSSIIIPKKVTNIDTEAFGHCESLSSIIVDEENPRYDSRYNCNAIIETKYNFMQRGCKNTFIPNGIEMIQYHCFSGCKGLKSIGIPNSVESIGGRIFADCPDLISVTIGNGVTEMGDEKLWDGYSCFESCPNITDIYCYADPTEIAWYQSDEGLKPEKETRFHVYNKSVWVEKYPNANVTFVDDYTDRGKCGDGLVYTYNGDEKMLRIETSGDGTATMSNYDADLVPWNYYGADIEKLVIEEGVQTIGDNAFSSIDGDLLSITLPSTITSIGNSSFYGFKGQYIDLSACTSLPAITINRNAGVFNGVSLFTRIYLPDGKGHMAGNGVNVIIGRTCTGALTFIDGLSFGSPIEFTANNVSYNRTFTSGVTATVCLPYTIAAANVTGGKFYSFEGVSDDFVVTMNEVTGDIQANTPYLFVPSATGMTFGGSVTVSIVNGNTETSTSNGNWTFCGTYEKIIWAEEEDFGGDAIYGYAANAYGDNVNAGDFVRVEASANSYINPYRAYLKFSKSSTARRLSSVKSLPARMKVKLVDGNENVTLINIVDVNKEASDVWYTIEGRPLPSEPMQKGVYIRNGVKVIK